MSIDDADVKLSSLPDGELKEQYMQMITTAANVFKDLMERIESNPKYQKPTS